MGLNKTKGNMYEFITHTWNPLNGKCSHNCSYCYVEDMKRFPVMKEKYSGAPRLDEKELKTNLGNGNFIFVGSSCDMFAADIPREWIQRVIDYCKKFDNKYLLQTKNPGRYNEFDLPDNFIIGCTIETNRFYPCMGKTSIPLERVAAISLCDNKKFVTIEPILDFDVEKFAVFINHISPNWVNIGADSGHNGLPEPSKEKIEQLIKSIDAKITIKKNMKRLNEVSDGKSISNNTAQ